MSDLISRLRQRAHLREFAICGEAAAALEAAEWERDEAVRRYGALMQNRGAGSSIITVSRPSLHGEAEFGVGPLTINPPEQ